MKALFHIQKDEYSEIGEFFSGIHPWILKIAGKPILEYLLDFAILNDCTEIRLVMDEPDQDVRNYFAEGERWGIDISYSNCFPGDRLDRILEKNSRYCKSGPLLIFDGLFFLHYDKEYNYENFFTGGTTAKMLSCATGALVYTESLQSLGNLSNAAREMDLSLSPINSLQDLFDLTMQILKWEQHHYVLPGYDSDKEIIIGRNVTISKTAQLKPPVLIADGARIGGQSIIGPNAVIGKESVVDEEVRVQDSIISDRSFLSKGLIFEGKMVNKENIFSVRDDVWLNLCDDHLVGTVKPQLASSFVRPLLGRLIALLLLTLMVPLWVIFKAILYFTAVEQQHLTLLADKEGKTFDSRLDLPASGKFLDSWFYGLSLHKVSLLYRVLTGTLSLVGNRPLLATKENLQTIQSYTFYTPGAFGYSESEKHVPGSLEEEMAEQFYAAKNSFADDTGTLFNVLTGNLKSYLTSK